MDKTIHNKRYFLYSSLSHELQSIYCSEIYRFLFQLNFEYKGFGSWYRNLFLGLYELKPDREIIICEEQLAIVGVAIVKNDLYEKKICTLRVEKEYQRQGIGHELVEMCFGILNTEKPMITLHKNKLHQFEKLLNYYDFELEQTKKHYYSLFNTELVFNGALPQKDSIFSQIKLLDVEQLYMRSYNGKQNFEDFVDNYIWYWYYRGKMRLIKLV